MILQSTYSLLLLDFLIHIDVLPSKLTIINFFDGFGARGLLPKYSEDHAALQPALMNSSKLRDETSNLAML